MYFLVLVVGFIPIIYWWKVGSEHLVGVAYKTRQIILCKQRDPHWYLHLYLSERGTIITVERKRKLNVNGTFKNSGFE